MNERIEKLALQADAYAWEQIDEGANFDEQPRYFAEKFAELIVRECACIADDMKSLDVAAAIKDHFGVEE